MFGVGLADSSSRILINSAAVIRTGLPSTATMMDVLVLMAMSSADFAARWMAGIGASQIRICRGPNVYRVHFLLQSINFGGRK